MQPNVGNQRAYAAMARQDYEKETASAGGSSGNAFDNCGPPTWDRSAWEAFRARYGQYPFSGKGPFPTTMAGAPPWVYQLMGLRQPPVTVTLGSGSV